ncbi:hypothetical protein MPTK1_6g04900 [Marchantia polymorpha subsp. ruderalis]|uniref:Uncharacterized protein n=2 Tax=Marchantia polymorpha TaxID=3197 RepID=A0AAF6BNL6_MARPO|nr:hypothetical protein MARPO_0034s0027 [Marchantia polymorpha]PTQ41430.1 hypothetical protein MARPO_0034s0027 [Marchantia polymorpha]BBN13600.1 hypothetical protein Mp_6g04900 [Marchantia polymorpha subsp. ruderalis]BBN13601.1 hypothetical protein Mp_6g04900 [Marchantia polymorpha subsp. ruderalis]|eukprot:PTQ41429.1 hypothetical protein MARPO_0034s0027 [Marchantia polymorpha]
MSSQTTAEFYLIQLTCIPKSVSVQPFCALWQIRTISSHQPFVRRKFFCTSLCVLCSQS